MARDSSASQRQLSFGLAGPSRQPTVTCARPGLGDPRAGEIEVTVRQLTKPARPAGPPPQSIDAKCILDWGFE